MKHEEKGKEISDTDNYKVKLLYTKKVSPINR